MKKSLIISEADNIAALMENDRVVEFFVNRGELLLGDVYVAIVENILPGIDAAFVNLGKDKMGFLHANDIPGEGALKERLVPKQKLLVQITKEPTGHKGPRVSTAISLPGRFLVLVPEERGISISRRISEAKERARLKAVVTLMKPPGVGVIIRTEAKGQNDQSLFEDFELLWDRWQTIVSEGEASIGPKLVYRDQDLLYRVIRDAYSTDVSEIIVDSADGQRRASEFMSGWAGRNTKVLCHTGDESLLMAKGIDKEIESVLLDRADLPSGGHLNIQPTEALTVIDVNSGRFTSSRTQAETVRRTNLEAAQEIPRQLRLRNIGGMVIVDFIDMESRRDQQQVLEVFNRSLEDDRAKPQVGQMSDLGLVELTRRRQGQSLRELFASQCSHCSGSGVMPSVSLGGIELKRPSQAKDDEPAARGRGAGMRRSAGAKVPPPLRAASATGGRIQSTVQDFSPEEDDEEGEEELLEIFDQVPEELLEQSGTPGGSGKFPKFAHEEDVQDELPEPEEQEPPRFERGYEHGQEKDSDRAFNRGSNRDFARRDKRGFGRQNDRNLERRGGRDRDRRSDRPFERGFDRTRDDEFEPIAEVESTASGLEERHDIRLESEGLEHGAPERVPEHDEAMGASEDDERAPEPKVEKQTSTEPVKLPESPYETEIDPLTGIYTLKVKKSNEPESLTTPAAYSLLSNLSGAPDEPGQLKLTAFEQAQEQDTFEEPVFGFLNPEKKEPYYQELSDMLTLPLEGPARNETFQTLFPHQPSAEEPGLPLPLTEMKISFDQPVGELLEGPPQEREVADEEPGSHDDENGAADSASEEKPTQLEIHKSGWWQDVD